LLRAARTDGRGAVVVLHGDAGTGKTSAVQTIASEAGFDQAFEIARLSTEKRAEDFRWRAMAAAKQALDPRTSLLVVDEGDEIDEDSLRGKGVLTELLDSSAHCWIFVGNAKPFSHEALQRRVSFEIEFSKPDKLFRQRLWESIAREEGLDLGAQKVARISEELALSPGSIHTVCRDARRLHAQSSCGQALDEVVMETGCMHAKGLGLNFEPKDQSKKPEGLIWREDCLNVRGGLDDPLRKLHAFAKRFREKDPTLPVRQMCLLASGEPGTGKSAFIRQLADQAEIPLHAHTAADVLGAYVGETEKGIRRVFHAAREEGALLFLDEVDSLLWSRSRAERSWEVTQVNQLLQEIDRFEGLFAAATNNVDILDPAVLRRFQVKLEFLPLNAEQRIRLWKEQFAGIVSEPDVPEEELRSLEGLVAGDFRVVWMQAAMEDRPCSSADLLNRLRTELESRPSRSRPMGFAR
jgi:SpoVK/Ycf46/Vps4 family AAA+-type ATPase